MHKKNSPAFLNNRISNIKFARKKILQGIFLLIFLPLLFFSWGCPRKTQEVSSIEQRLSKYKTAPPDALFQLARAAASFGKYDAAQYFLKVLLEKNPNFAPAYSTWGLIYLKLNDYNKAEALFQKALALNPNDEVALMNLAVIRIKQKRYLEGKELLEKAVRAAPDYVDAWFNLGNLYDKMGDYVKSIEAFQKLIDLRPEEGGFYYKLGILYLKKEMFDEALNVFLKAQKYSKDKYQPYYQAAIIYHMKKQIYLAVKNYKKAVVLKPTHFESYLNLADIYLFELNDKDQAKFYYERARSIRPSDPYVNKRLQEIASGKYDYMKKKNLADFIPPEEKAKLQSKKKKKNRVVSSADYKSRLEKFKHGQVLYIKKVDKNSKSTNKKTSNYDSSFSTPTPLPKNGKGGKYLQFSNPEELRKLLQSEGIGQ